MDGRSISGNFSGATLGDNVNLQGDNVSQNKTQNSGLIPEDLFQVLINEIKGLKDEDEKKDSLDNVVKIKESLQKNNLERAKKVFGWLPEIIRTTAAGIAIAKAIGIL